MVRHEYRKSRARARAYGESFCTHASPQLTLLGLREGRGVLLVCAVCHHDRADRGDPGLAGPRRKGIRAGCPWPIA
jgi:hypothetical protein